MVTFSARIDKERFQAWCGGYAAYQVTVSSSCWFGLCAVRKLPGMAYCAQHELLYRANHDGGSHLAGSLKKLDEWEQTLSTEIT